MDFFSETTCEQFLLEIQHHKVQLEAQEQGLPLGTADKSSDLGVVREKTDDVVEGHRNV